MSVLWADARSEAASLQRAVRSPPVDGLVSAVPRLAGLPAEGWTTGIVECGRDLPAGPTGYALVGQAGIEPATEGL